MMMMYKKKYWTSMFLFPLYIVTTLSGTPTIHSVENNTLEQNSLIHPWYYWEIVMLLYKIAKGNWMKIIIIQSSVVPQIGPESLSTPSSSWSSDYYSVPSSENDAGGWLSTQDFPYFFGLGSINIFLFWAENRISLCCSSITYHIM